jgi:hypothetical protein
LVLVKDFLANKNVTTQINPHTLLTWLQQMFLPVFPLFAISTEGQRLCDAIDIIKTETKQLKRISQDGFQECFQTPLQSLAQVYSCINGCNIFYFDMDMSNG